MATIITRQTSGGGVTVKGSPLTNAEMDTNLININLGITSAAAITGGTIDGVSIGATTPSTGRFTSLTTDQTTFNLINATATTLNIGGAATTLSIGASTGTLTIKNAGLVHDSTSYTKVAVGTDAQRPGSPSSGMIRYNSDIGSFEGYGSAWASLGGVKSVDGLTYIIAETSPGASNDELEFYAATGSLTTTKVGGWNQTRLLVSTDMTVTGNLTVNGTTTTINSTTISVDDKNIELGSVASPTDTTADGGGITLKGSTDKTFNWVDATDAWTSSEHMNLASGKAYYINGTSVLNSTTLGSGVTSSSLTSVGTLSSLTVSGNTTLSSITSGSVLFAGTSGLVSQDNANLFWDDANNRLGIGTNNPGYKLEVNGSFAATTKSFVIPHPTKDGMKLRYGSLEGPENGVYVRGRLKDNNVIELPEYWTALVDENTITVNLTPIGSHQKLYVKDISNNTVTVGNENLLSKSINCFYIVFAERKDVEKLQVEI